MRSASHDGTHSNGHKRPELPAAPLLDPALIPCGVCGSPNPRDRKFCSQCGKPLWRPCDNCGETNAVAENFCGACGKNLRSAVQERVEQFENILSEAQQCRQAAEFGKAVALLRGAIKEHQGQLIDHVHRARQLIQQYTTEQQQSLADAEATFQKAVQCVANQSYEHAQSLLEDVPEALRHEAIQHLLGEVRSKRNEILALGGEIRQALAEKKTLDLMPKLERLIELQPQHEQAKVLAGQLRLRLHEAARKRLARHKYQEALDLLRRVPAFLRDKDDERLLAQAEELDWLMTDLQTEPVVSETLVAVAERLSKLAPSNPHAAKLQQELQQRLRKRAKDPRFPAVAWAAPPQKRRLDCPIHWLGGFGRLSNDAVLNAPACRQNPGTFFVACGLALQGLEKSPIQLNLAPKKKGGLAAFSLLKRRRAPQSAWGFDVGDAALKAVKLRADDDGNVAIDVCDRVEYKKTLSQPEVEFKRSDVVREAFDELFRRHPREAERVCISLPGAKMLGRQFDLPAVKGKKIQDAIEFEAAHQIPYPLSDLVWDYQLLDEPGRKGDDIDDGTRQHHVLLVAAKDYHVTDFLALLEHMQLSVDVVQSNSIALHNYACYEFFDGRQPAENEALALLDVGSESSSVVISSPSRVWFRSLRLGGGDITRALMKHFKLPLAQAEQLKRRPQQARRFSQLYGALAPLLEELAGELERSFGMHQKVYPRQSVTKVYGLGGGFQLHGLYRHLLHAAEQRAFVAED